MPWHNGAGAQYSPLVYKPTRRYEAWRFLSYMFIHLYHWHLVQNIIVQLVLGIPLEMVHGSLRVGIVYCMGVIAGKGLNSNGHTCHSQFEVWLPLSPSRCDILSTGHDKYHQVYSVFSSSTYVYKSVFLQYACLSF